MLHPTLYKCLPKVSLKNCLIVIFLQEVRGLSSTRLPTMFPHILHQPLKATGLAALGCCLLEAPQQPAPTAVGAPLCHSCAHIPCGRSALAKKRNRRPKSLVCRITAITQCTGKGAKKHESHRHCSSQRALPWEELDSDSPILLPCLLHSFRDSKTNKKVCLNSQESGRVLTRTGFALLSLSEVRLQQQL